MNRRVRCIPSSDITLHEIAAAALDAMDGHATGEEIEQILRAALSDRYPLVDIHRQAALARVAGEELWYVYRDGRPRAATTASPRMVLANPLPAGRSTAEVHAVRPSDEALASDSSR
jgi:hypothetical protein